MKRYSKKHKFTAICLTLSMVAFYANALSVAAAPAIPAEKTTQPALTTQSTEAAQPVATDQPTTTVQPATTEKSATAQPAAETTAETVKPLTEAELAAQKLEADIDAYFANSVFVGDSIMLGFRNYSMKQKDSFLNDIKFLASGGFSVTNALWDVTEKSVHPVYKGKKQQIWHSISAMKADKVFLLFGMNDLNVSGLEGTCEKYEQLMANILEKSPDAEIHVISMTYTLKDAGKGKLNNDTIREFNKMLKELADKNGWGYLDMATALADKNGDLAAAYCSDGFVHQSRAAYGVWTNVIRKYAKEQIELAEEEAAKEQTEPTEEDVAKDQTEPVEKAAAKEQTETTAKQTKATETGAATTK